jgi:hypothetical protein
MSPARFTEPLQRLKLHTKKPFAMTASGAGCIQVEPPSAFT